MIQLFIASQAERLQPLYSASEAYAILYWLLEERIGWKRGQGDRPLSEKERDLLLLDVNHLLEGKPIQQVLGKAYFLDLILKVNEHVLIPRPETEELVDLVRQYYPSTSSLRILDIGTGSGCIAIALAKHFTHAEVHALDISAEALLVAKENALHNRVQVSLHEMDVLERWPQIGPVDVVVSNPPYIMPSEQLEMHKNVLAFEPSNALFVPQENPLLFYEAIAKHSSVELGQGARVFLEINRVFGQETLALFVNRGFEGNVHRDMQSNNRFVVATKK